MAVLRSQYASSKSFNASTRCHAAKITGHYPYDPVQMFMRHPGMSIVDKEVRERCLEAVKGSLKSLSCSQGWLRETDLDDAKIPETAQQTKARADGRRVKDQDRHISHWRFCFFNHEGTVQARTKMAEEKQAEKATKQKNAEARLLRKTSETAFKNGNRLEGTITETQAAQYEFLPEETDTQCHFCKGFKVSWVLGGLGPAKNKNWRTPVVVPGELVFQSCQSELCITKLVAENKLHRKLKTAAVDAEKAVKQRKAALTAEISELEISLAATKKKLSRKRARAYCFCDGKEKCDKDMIGCDGMGVIGCKWFGCQEECEGKCCGARGWVCRSFLEADGKSFDETSELDFVCSLCTQTKASLASFAKAQKDLSQLP